MPAQADSPDNTAVAAASASSIGPSRSIRVSIAARSSAVGCATCIMPSTNSRRPCSVGTRPAEVCGCLSSPSSSRSCMTLRIEAGDRFCLAGSGRTRVLRSTGVESNAPPWLGGKGRGWMPAEYGMLPRATHTRGAREAAKGKQSGRTQEIQRLIGRSLRAVIDLERLGERTVKLDCDVIQADGGTRTASVTGAFVALHDAVATLLERGILAAAPIRDFVAGASVGLFGGVPVLDLDYAEDSECETDMNVVMTGSGGFVEVQGTAEGAPFSAAQMDALLALAKRGIAELIAKQKAALGLS